MHERSALKEVSSLEDNVHIMCAALRPGRIRGKVVIVESCKVKRFAIYLSTEQAHFVSVPHHIQGRSLGNRLPWETDKFMHLPK